MRLPAAERGEWVHLFDVLTASALPVTSHSDARRMLDRDRRWWERARDLGGTRYPIGAIEFAHDDWGAALRRPVASAAPQQAPLRPGRDPHAGPGIF
jgi:hypothetical protein